MTAGNVVNFPKVTQYSGGPSVNCSAKQDGDTVKINAQLSDSDASYQLTLTGQDATSIRFKLDIEQNTGNFISLALKSPTDEEIYGLGLQYTVWNFKNKQVPLIVDEGGVGRGLQPITRELNMMNGSGGSEVTTYAPAATFITNKQRAIQVSNTEIGIADFKQDETELLYWHASSIEG